MLATAALAASVALSPMQEQRIDAIVRRVMREDHIPGLSLGIARHGRVLLLRGYGVANRETHRASSGDTIYAIGSLTKQFTAALTLQQIARGTLTLDHRIDGVTVRQLLAQTSGLATYTTPGATIESVLQEPPQFTPGTRWAYSNTNYYVLGTMLERAAHVSFADLLARDITTPLDLNETTLGAPAGDNAATGYEWDDGAYIAIPSDDSNERLAFSAAGMSSSARDILNWLDALERGAVLSPPAFWAMTNSATLSNGVPTHYGYGFYVRNWYGWRTVEHPGSVDGFSADDALVVDDGLEIVALANTSDAWLLPLTKSIVALLEPARDSALVVHLNAPPVNENPRVTSQVRAIVLGIQNGTLERAQLSRSLNRTLDAAQLRAGERLLRDVGPPRLIEFVEQTVRHGVAYERYRVTFSVKQFWVTVSYYGWKVNTLSIQPDDE